MISLITQTATQYGNEVHLSYAHEPPTARDLRRMAKLMRLEADRCIEYAIAMEYEQAKIERRKDEYLP